VTQGCSKGQGGLGRRREHCRGGLPQFIGHGQFSGGVPEESHLGAAHIEYVDHMLGLSSCVGNIAASLEWGAVTCTGHP
jgi:hypothetical protein